MILKFAVAVAVLRELRTTSFPGDLALLCMICIGTELYGSHFCETMTRQRPSPDGGLMHAAAEYHSNVAVC